MSEEQKSEGQVVSSGFKKKKKVKRNWTVAICKRYAGRFSSEEEWAKGSPSSYKAAKSRDWVAECVAHQDQKQNHRNDEVKLPMSA